MSFIDDLPAHRGVTMNGHVGWANYGDENNMVVLFYYRPILNGAKSKEAGRPFYDDVIYVKYHGAGGQTERLNINDRPATDEHKRRWPKQWSQFQQNKEQINDGTPVDLLYPEHPSIGATCRASSIFTVEQLSSLEGGAIDSLGMGSQRWVNDARKYLEAANKGVGASQLRSELEVRDSEIRVLKQQIDQLKDEIRRVGSGVGIGSGSVTVEQIAAMIAQAQVRPILPGPGVPQVKAFDAAEAQINAVHPTTEIAHNKGKRKAS